MNISEIKKYKGQVGLDVNLDELRDRKNKRSSLKDSKKKLYLPLNLGKLYGRATSEYEKKLQE